jgi:hypothetical protein
VALRRPLIGLSDKPLRRPLHPAPLPGALALVSDPSPPAPMRALPTAITGDRGRYILGRTGTGKSTLLLDLILNDAKAGSGMCVIDAHGDLIRDVMSHLPQNRRGDVILLDLLAPDVAFGINPFSCSDPDNPIALALTVSQVMQVFERVWGFKTAYGAWGAKLEQVLRNLAMVFIHHGLTMAEVPLFLDWRVEQRSKRNPLRKALIDSLPDAYTQLFWELFDGMTPYEKRDLINSTTNKVDAFVGNPLLSAIVGQERDTVDFGEAMDGRKIVLVSLSAQLPEASTLIGSMIAGRILEAALARANRYDRIPFTLFADEYQRFATADFTRLLTETRKYGVPTTVAHQFRAQLDPENQGATLNAGAIICFELIPEDAETLAGLFDATPGPEASTHEQPVRVPVGDPLNWLVRNGHPNPQVTQLTDRWLRYLVDLSRQYRGEEDDVWWGNSGMGGRQLLRGTQEVNTFLVGAQRGEPSLPALAEAICSLAGMLGVMSQQAKTWRTGRWGQEYESVSHEVEPEIVALMGQDPEAGFAALEAAYGNPEGVENARQFGQDLATLGALLYEEPIMVNSGRYEPAEERVRPYSDVRAQNTNKLATLPKYTAWGRVDGREVDLVVSRRDRGTDWRAAPAGMPREQVKRLIEDRHADLEDLANPPRRMPRQTVTGELYEGPPPGRATQRRSGGTVPPAFKTLD